MSLKNIAVLTSGGDNAGLNAAVRAITRVGIARNVNVYGVLRGYRGLVEGQIFELNSRAVSGKMGLGGTFIGTARLPEWKDPKVRREAIRNMNRHDIGGLIVIGGNGSLSGASLLAKDGFPVIGMPGSIDDDVMGTEVCVGVDTALNIIIEAIDRIRDCASSIQRAFVIEVMGRDSGALALMSAAATGAEVCLVPEIPSPPMEKIADAITNAYTKGKPYAIIVVAEGWKPGINKLVEFLNSKQDETGFDVRTTVLGYTQRGGSPSYIDRYYGTAMGAFAVDSLLAGETNKFVAVQNGKPCLQPLDTLVGKLKPLNKNLLDLYNKLDN
ncbi:Phosphofructokinase family protein [Trichomonas vaginalis G3]|uniref:6-phosphofructokinase n=1 Tax=Trichomonas vaginalis (strain ATCC PRA-98 / G3) TaxID=412133 RepID=A2FKA7_TRIV3|nr:6-phosphofructokinase protein [Trichomonas vaginalis G3]EAX94647.1 Phosphofructokinase family protein [Trichomonas vaginalis G3]KAI5503818.1 6-phosphofructokinase protein [Trichomonas vaginalis G3]|eukprot:XP_001307577.1 Phosphofructokinase family protein [Trichomonas vaginalis G3]